MIELFDLAGADAAVRFSPYCWRTRMALAHKDLPVNAVAWRFTEGEALAFSGQGRVPVIRDGDRVVSDSWAIARYLEREYPERPSLFGGPKGEAHALFVNSWADGVLLPGIVPLIVADLFGIIAEQDKAYFRSSREKRFGRRLEEVQKGRDTGVLTFRTALAPLRRTLELQSFLGGDGPSYADHIVAGSLMWPRVASAFALLAGDDPVLRWQETMLDLYGGLGRKQPLAHGG